MDRFFLFMFMLNVGLLIGVTLRMALASDDEDMT